MATDKQNLIDALANVTSQIKDMTTSPKPTYSVDGQSVSWGEHFNNLIKARTELRRAIQEEEGAWIIQSRGVQTK